MTGRPRKPTALRVLQGNAGKRPLPKREPKPKRGIPSPPSWLSTRAKAVWRELGGQLDVVGVLTVQDRRALELLCDAYDEWRSAREKILEHGATYESVTDAGGLAIKPRPEVAQASDAWKRVRAMLLEFGLTPAARAKVSASEPEPEDPFEELLRRGKSQPPKPSAAR